MSATRPRMAAEERKQCVLAAACRVFSRSSYRGATTAEIARESGVTEPVLYRHFPSKRDLYLACLDAGWAYVRRLWDEALAAEPDPRNQVGAMGRAYVELQRTGERILLSELWIQALTEAADDPKIRKYLRGQIQEVHDYVAHAMRRSQATGGIQPERDLDAEAWIFISLGLLSTMDRRLGVVGQAPFEAVFASRRAWMVGEDSP
jgi:TetR/AcrR family transcriptional regulator